MVLAKTAEDVACIRVRLLLVARKPDQGLRVRGSMPCESRSLVHLTLEWSGGLANETEKEYTEPDDGRSDVCLLAIHLLTSTIRSPYHSVECYRA